MLHQQDIFIKEIIYGCAILLLRFEMPASVLKRLMLSRLSFYVRGTNLWTKTFDKNITMDPEQGINGTNDLQFFIPKSITVGLNIEL